MQSKYCRTADSASPMTASGIEQRTDPTRLPRARRGTQLVAALFLAPVHLGTELLLAFDRSVGDLFRRHVDPLMKSLSRGPGARRSAQGGRCVRLGLHQAVSAPV